MKIYIKVKYIKHTAQITQLKPDEYKYMNICVNMKINNSRFNFDFTANRANILNEYNIFLLTQQSLSSEPCTFPVTSPHKKEEEEEEKAQIYKYVMNN